MQLTGKGRQVVTKVYILHKLNKKYTFDQICLSSVSSREYTRINVFSFLANRGFLWKCLPTCPKTLYSKLVYTFALHRVPLVPACIIVHFQFITLFFIVRQLYEKPLKIKRRPPRCDNPNMTKTKNNDKPTKNKLKKILLGNFWRADHFRITTGSDCG